MTTRILGWLVKSFVAAYLCLLHTSSASAATRTVCFHAQVMDARVSCPNVSAPGGGILRPCEDGAQSHTYFVGGVIELWDNDHSTTPDDYIGTWVISGAGQQCATFEWETASYALDSGFLEAHPDVYPQYRPHVRHTSGGGAIIRATNSSGTEAPPITFRNVVQFENCTGTCNFSNVLWNTNTASSTTGQQYMILDSAQRTLQVYASVMDYSTIDARYGASACSTDADASSVSRTEICFASLSGFAGDRPNHEMGHTIQQQLFEQDSLNSVYIGGSWTLTGPETDSAATQEGFASYVAAVSWYNPQVSTALPKYRGFAIENSAPQSGTCANNRKIPGQSAKAFWDYDDINNEDGLTGLADDDDESSKTTTFIAQEWDGFQDGTGNNQDRETGDDGVNMWDYQRNAELGSAAVATLLRHNCQEGQDQN